MASTAISAQGATVSIGASTGTAKTASAATVGFPTIFTSAAHGFANGDALTPTGLTGTAATLFNGVTVIATNVTANTFAIDLDSTGLTITAFGTFTPVTWTKIGNTKSFNGPDGSAAELDVSNLDSTGKEFLMGLPDSGNVAIESDHDENNAGQAACRAAYQARALKPFRILLPNGKAISFSAFVKKFSIQGGVDQVVKASIDLRISGAYTVA